jgi:N-acetylmuramoyl-L-alanine amidase
MGIVAVRRRLIKPIVAPLTLVKMVVVRDVRLVLAAVLLVGMGGCATGVPPAARFPLRSPLGPSVVGRVGYPPTVVLDAGHGGHDPGTAHYGLKEKHLALDIAKHLRAALQEEGIQVVMTRESDRFIPLKGRAAVANRLNADLFVSVHVNANRNRGVSGIEVYYPRESEVSPNASWPPEVSASEIGTPSTTMKSLLWDVMLTHAREESHGLAGSICRTMREALGVRCRGTKPARFVVLRQAWMPSVLVEVGYLTHRAEAGRLRVASYRQAVARAIAGGILAHLQGAAAQGQRMVGRPTEQ